MKKAITILLALVYFGTSTGATIHMHFCMGKMTGWGLTANSSDKCGKCGMQKSVKKDGHCCKDEVKVIKNASDQKINPIANFRFISFEAVSFTPGRSDFTTEFLCSVKKEKPYCNAPPRYRSIAGYIFFRSFLM